MSAGWRLGLKKIGPFWQYRFSHRGKLKVGSTKCANFNDARNWLATFKSRLARAEVGDLDAPTVTRAFENWLSMKKGFCSEANLSRAKRAMDLHVIPIIGTMKADRVRSSDVARVVQTYLEGKGPHGRARTIDGANVVISYLRAVFAGLVDDGYLVKIPFKIKKQKTQVKPRTTLPIDLIEPFLDHIDQHAHLHIRVAVRFMLWMGLRETESLSVRWEWMRGKSKMAHGATKGKEEAKLDIPEDLQELLANLPKDSTWVLPGKGDAPHRQQFTRKAIERAGVAVGVPGLTPHRLRATYATLLSQTGASVYEVQKLLRHKQLSTTLHYVQTDEKSLAEANQRLYRLAHQPRVPPASDQPAVAEPQVVPVTNVATPYSSQWAQIVNFVPMSSGFTSTVVAQRMTRVSQAEGELTVPVA
jgi:integrase